MSEQSLVEEPDPLSLAQEAKQLREEQDRVAKRLEEIGVLLDQQGPVEWIADGYKYRVRTQHKKTFKFDEDKFRLVDPDVYERVAVRTVDPGKLKAEIAAGTATHWLRYAQYVEGRPFVAIVKEEIE